MNRNNTRMVRKAVSLVLVTWLTVGLVVMRDWLAPTACEGRGFAGGPRAGVATGPRGTVAYSPRGSVAVGSRGGAAVRGPAGAAAVGPNGGAAVRGPYGGAAVGPNGGAAVRGPYGGAARGPNGNVVAAPRGRVVPPPPLPYPPGYRPPVPVPVPVPVAPAYYGPSGAGVAAGMAIGAMLTVLPATAVAMSASSGRIVYVVDNKCYKEVNKQGSKYYEQITCP
jgi:hypothetical protein